MKRRQRGLQVKVISDEYGKEYENPGRYGFQLEEG